MIELTAQRIAEFAGGRLAMGAGDATATGVSIDSRAVNRGDVFFAIRGEKVDGHRFIIDALDRGAVGVIATHLDADHLATLQTRGAFGILVNDSIASLQSLARGYRRLFTLSCIGITGSTGKTTTKDMTSAVLSTVRRVVSTRGNHNNEIGLPLTVLELTQETECLVVEMGMRGKGQIEALCKIALPDVGIVTNVNDTHIELLGSRQEIAEAKSELLRSLPGDGGAVLNNDDPLVSQMSRYCKGRVLRVGLLPGAEITACDIRDMGLDGVEFTVNGVEGLKRLRIPLPGVHNVHNALLAVGAAVLQGVDSAAVAEGLMAMSKSPMRMAVRHLPSGAIILDDCYNASPVSMRAALRTLVNSGQGRRTIAVLADMLELGSVSESAHREVGRFMAEDGPDVLVTVGERAALIAEAFSEAQGDKEVWTFYTNSQAICKLKELVGENDIVLVKGSRGMHMDEIVKALTSV